MGLPNLPTALSGGRVVASVTLSIALLVSINTASRNASLVAAPPSARPAPDDVGLLLNASPAFPGYTLFAPMGSTSTYLVDNNGKFVHTWHNQSPLAASVYLLENGHLLRTGMVAGEPSGGGSRAPAPGADPRNARRGVGPGGFNGRPPGPGGPRGLGGGGAGGRVQEYAWDGQLVWDFQLANDALLLHHDIEPLPNGNVLMIAWERKTAEQAIAAGRAPGLQGNRDLQPDAILEVKPSGKTTGEIVWQWHIWDHLIQDFDPAKANYGDVHTHPERIDINYTPGWVQQLSAKAANKLRSLGYLRLSPPPGAGPGGPGGPDWTHTNSVAYNAELDQILLSVHAFHEIWVIDHSTTPAQAAGHVGGRGGKGGDLLYRWGNPRAYRAGTRADQRLFAQHDASWIPRGLPGEGHILVFNNGRGRPGGDYSSVDEIVPPVDGQGRYAYHPGTAYGPDRPTWTYAAPNKADFYASHISGAQRLPNGNTLVCSGERGMLFEVTPEKEVVWKYASPFSGGPGPGGFGFPPPPAGRSPRGDFPRPGQILPSLLRQMLGLTSPQRTQLDRLQKEVGGRLGQILDTGQQRRIEQLQPGFGPDGFGSPAPPGQLVTPFVQAKLKLTDQQKERVRRLQKEVDGKLSEILTQGQRKTLQQMRSGLDLFRFAGPPGTGGPGQPEPRGGIGRFRGDGGGEPPRRRQASGVGQPGFPGGGFGPPGRGPGRFGPPGPGPARLGPGRGELFRACRYGVDYPGLLGKDLTKGKTFDELQSADSR